MFSFIALNYCENNPGICKNGAKCVSLTSDDGSYKCLCRERTYGKNCEMSDYAITVKPENATSKPPQKPVIRPVKPVKPEKPLKPENITLVYAEEAAPENEIKKEVMQP